MIGKDPPYYYSPSLPGPIYTYVYMHILKYHICIYIDDFNTWDFRAWTKETAALSLTSAVGASMDLVISRACPHTEPLIGINITQADIRDTL